MAMIFCSFVKYTIGNANMLKFLALDVEGQLQKERNGALLWDR